MKKVLRVIFKFCRLISIYLLLSIKPKMTYNHDIIMTLLKSSIQKLIFYRIITRLKRTDLLQFIYL